MSIQSIQNDRATLLAGGMQDKANSVGSQKSTAPSGEENKALGSGSFEDQYIKSDEESKSPLGLYKLVKDEEGNPQIIVDGAKPGKGDVGKHPDDIPSESPNKSVGKKDGGKAMRCTVNTDKVDTEIKKLKQEKQKLQQEIQRAAANEDQANELKNRLFEIENELRLKDNDSYRKQNATYSFG